MTVTLHERGTNYDNPIHSVMLPHPYTCGHGIHEILCCRWSPDEIRHLPRHVWVATDWGVGYLLDMWNADQIVRSALSDLFPMFSNKNLFRTEEGWLLEYDYND